MITLNETWIMPINLIALLLTIFFAVEGFKRGFLRSVLSLIGTIASFYLGWILSDNMSLAFPLVHNTSSSELLQQMSEQIYTFANRIIWFIILFLFFRLICLILDLLLKSLHSIPGYHYLSCILGMVFGFIETVFWILILCVFLECPLFSGGSVVVESSVLGTVEDIVTPISEDFFEPVINSNAFSKLGNNIDSMSEDKIQEIKDWLESEGYNNGN